MRFVFLTGCIEPGKDGVGDYTRLLSRECIRQGHQCLVISINDHFAVSPVSANAADDTGEIRLPATLAWAERIAKAREKIDEFKPDWISVQFVSYGLQRKGIIFGLIRGLTALAKNIRVHVMLHELWIGEDNVATFKSRIIGRIQKYFILEMIRSLKPEVIHTSNQAYCALLKLNGVASSTLPLFGSIPVVAEARTDWIIERLRMEGVNVAQSSRESFWFFGMFGSLHPVWPPEPLLSMLIDEGKADGKKVVLLAVGRIGPGALLWQKISQEYRGRISCAWLGELSAGKVSDYLQFIDFGIATSPYDLCGKSGTVAAMLEHGLPVVVNRIAPHFRTIRSGDFDSDPQLMRLDAELPRKLKSQIKRKPRARIVEITRRFLSALGVTQAVMTDAPIQTELKKSNWAGEPIKSSACES